MKLTVSVGGVDLTGSTLVDGAQIQRDLSTRVSSASFKLIATTARETAEFDYANFDESRYSIDLRELMPVQIFGDGKVIFGGFITALASQQTAPDVIFYSCTANDYSWLVDRTTCVVDVFANQFDGQIIKALFAKYLPEISAADVQNCAMLTSYDATGKALRQVIEDLAVVGVAEWWIDALKAVHYRAAADPLPAPFSLSTSPDYVTTFGYALSGYQRDFRDAANNITVIGGVDPIGGTIVTGQYRDPVSVAAYGELSKVVVDRNVKTWEDATLKATALVGEHGMPQQSGTVTVRKDGLDIGQAVHIHDDVYGFDGSFLIRSLTITQEKTDPPLTKYAVKIGANQPDIERFLRLLDARQKTQGSTVGVATPAPGSVTDASIGAGGLTASVIGSVSASNIIGQIQSDQIGSVNASAIFGQVKAEQIASVNAGAIAGVITSDQIGSVNATTIQGVIVSSQLADKIISDLSAYSDALRPVPMLDALPVLPSDAYIANTFVYNNADGHFYKVSADGKTFAQDDSVQGEQRFYHVGAIAAQNIVGLIVAAQIQSIAAGQITGQVQASQIGSVNASAITGVINAANIGNIQASAIQGLIQASQIAAVNAGSISGTISANQINSINADTITIGTVKDGNIASVSASKLLVGAATAQTVSVLDSGGQPIGYIGNLGSVSGGWFKVGGFGGTSYSTAAIYTDTSGYLYIRQSATNGSTITFSPTTFDTYNSLMMDVKSGSDEAQYVSRGVVIFSSGTKVGALARNQNNAAACDLELPGVGGNYILISSQYGTVRADKGFVVGGQTVINPSSQFVGTGIDIAAGGIRCGGVNPYVGGTQYNGLTQDIPNVNGKTLYVRGGIIVNYF